MDMPKKTMKTKTRLVILFLILVIVIGAILIIPQSAKKGRLKSLCIKMIKTIGEADAILSKEVLDGASKEQLKQCYYDIYSLLIEASEITKNFVPDERLFRSINETLNTERFDLDRKKQFQVFNSTISSYLNELVRMNQIKKYYKIYDGFIESEEQWFVYVKN